MTKNKFWKKGDRAFVAVPHNYMSYDEVVLKDETYLHRTPCDDIIDVVDVKSIMNSPFSYTVPTSYLYASKDEAMTALETHRAMYREELKQKMPANIYDLCAELLSDLGSMEDADYDKIAVYSEQLELLKARC